MKRKKRKHTLDGIAIFGFGSIIVGLPVTAFGILRMVDNRNTFRPDSPELLFALSIGILLLVIGILVMACSLAFKHPKLGKPLD